MFNFTQEGGVSVLSILQSRQKPKLIWATFWMRFSGPGFFGRACTHLAAVFAQPYRGRYFLAKLTKRGYVSPSAVLSHGCANFGEHNFIGDRAIVFQAKDGGAIETEFDVHINQDCILETGDGGQISIGQGSRLQPKCQLSAYRGAIRIGRNVQIAPNCAFYPYDHEYKLGVLVKQQGFRSRTGIFLGDDVWLGYGVIVLDGAQIGDGAIIGAGSLVKSAIPANAIAVGIPARVVGYRTNDSAPTDVR